MAKFKFSLITVVKNDEKNISRTIESVLNQKKECEIEYIVIDGNSNDRTLEIINSYKSQIDKIISEDDTGIYEAMNKGIKNCSGDIIGICNSGDIIHSKGISFVEKKFIEEKSDYVFGTVLRNYTGNKILKSGFDIKRIDYNFDFATAHSTGFYIKKKIIDKIGYYDTNFKCSADYDFYLRLIKKNIFLGSYTSKEELVGEVAQGGYSSKLSFIDHLLEETKIRIKNKQNYFFVGLIFVNAIIKRLIKKFISK